MRTILEREINVNSSNWVDSAQDRNYWRALVNATLNLRFPRAIRLVPDKKRPMVSAIVALTIITEVVFFAARMRENIIVTFDISEWSSS